MDKFRNERKHMPVQRKKSRPGMNQAAPQSKTDQIDDLASLGKHQTWLKEEAERSRQNFTKVCLLMDITYTVRRKWITDEKPTLSDIKDEYPCLFNQKQPHTYQLTHSKFHPGNAVPVVDDRLAPASTKGSVGKPCMVRLHAQPDVTLHEGDNILCPPDVPIEN
ncbi:hypothetical protein BSL78_28600 [Apostichopus japonicus]|uniref:Uncharacterized protein n=1 Tax=Stichopus japonicus TaxID=307972 RepID=A0A2G8JFP6_STIJA|nr:hypothetical protein BSL78_28600 [Apostichopus japonicus]